jgi:transposase-like protein
MATEAIEPIERWTAKRRVALVVSILKGETSVVEVARQHGLTVAEVKEWREKFLLGAENALRSPLRHNSRLRRQQPLRPTLSLDTKTGASVPPLIEGGVHSEIEGRTRPVFFVQEGGGSAVGVIWRRAGLDLTEWRAPGPRGCRRDGTTMAPAA